MCLPLNKCTASFLSMRVQFNSVEGGHFPVRAKRLVSRSDFKIRHWSGAPLPKVHHLTTSLHLPVSTSRPRQVCTQHQYQYLSTLRLLLSSTSRLQHQHQLSTSVSTSRLRQVGTQHQYQCLSTWRLCLQLMTHLHLSVNTSSLRQVCTLQLDLPVSTLACAR